MDPVVKKEPDNSQACKKFGKVVMKVIIIPGFVHANNMGAAYSNPLNRIFQKRFHSDFNIYLAHKGRVVNSPLACNHGEQSFHSVADTMKRIHAQYRHYEHNDTQDNDGRMEKRFERLMNNGID